MAEEPLWVDALRRDLEQLPKDYAQSHARLKTYREMFHREIAKAFEPIVSREAQERPQTSYDDKREFSSWIGREMRNLGVSAVCPKTHLPATIAAGVRDNEETSSRFVFITRAGGKRKHVIAHKISDLQICPDPVRNEGPAQFFDRDNRGWGRV